MRRRAEKNRELQNSVCRTDVVGGTRASRLHPSDPSVPSFNHDHDGWMNAVAFRLATLDRRTITCIPPNCILFAFLHPPLSIVNLKITSALPNDFPFLDLNFNFSPLFFADQEASVIFSLSVVISLSSSRLYYRPSAVKFYIFPFRIINTKIG
jgi:hypothetical protein